MTKNLLLSIMLVAAFATLSFTIPAKWHKAGSQPKKYDMGISTEAGFDGHHMAFIESKENKIDGFGTLMQNASVGNCAGKRVRMTGHMRSQNIEQNGWAGFWFRVDGPNTNKDRRCLAFDNMYDRAIKGTTGWKQYQITLDVPANATNLAFGALLGGTGRIWFDEIRFEIVDKDGQPTGEKIQSPANLSFEK